MGKLTMQEERPEDKVGRRCKTGQAHWKNSC